MGWRGWWATCEPKKSRSWRSWQFWMHVMYCSIRSCPLLGLSPSFYVLLHSYISYISNIYRLHLTRPTLLNPVKLTLLMLFLIFQRTRFFFNSLLMLGILWFIDQARGCIFFRITFPLEVGWMVLLMRGEGEKRTSLGNFFPFFFILLSDNSLLSP